MRYLVDMRLADASRPNTPQEGLSLIEQYVLPSLDLCRKYEEEKKIVAGGPMSATVGLALIVEAGSALELDQIVTSLPLWSRARTTVTPLTTFAGRAEILQPARERLKALVKA
jgi:alpha-beta hydrolase superfamily lysophospholipase